MWSSSSLVSVCVLSYVTKTTTSCTFPALDWITELKRILKQPSCFRRTLAQRVRAPWKHHCCFSSMKDQQVLLWASVLSGEGTWDGGKRESRWKDGGRGCDKETKGCRCEEMEYFGLSGRLLSVIQNWNQLLPSSTQTWNTTYYYGLSDWPGGGGHAVKDDGLVQVF